MTFMVRAETETGLGGLTLVEAGFLASRVKIAGPKTAYSQARGLFAKRK